MSMRTTASIASFSTDHLAILAPIFWTCGSRGGRGALQKDVKIWIRSVPQPSYAAFNWSKLSWQIYDTGSSMTGG